MKPRAIQIIQSEHSTLAAVLRSLTLMAEQGPSNEPERFFDVLRAMLFYIDEFPERQHHPKESALLFPMLVRAEPQLQAIVAQLDKEHQAGQEKVRALQQKLLAWELMGNGRRRRFIDTLQDYVRFYLEHMSVEEEHLLCAAPLLLSSHDWIELDRAFNSHRDPLATGIRDPSFERLFTRIVMSAPEPLGIGRAFESQAGQPN